MRLTNQSRIIGFLSDLENIENRQDMYQKQMTTGKKFILPSDDPLSYTLSKYYHSQKVANDQYIRNVSQIKNKLSTAENSLSKANELLKRFRELTIQGANDTLSLDDRKAIAMEMEQIIEELVNIANSTSEGKYIFAGTSNITKPFIAVKSQDPDLLQYGITDNLITSVEWVGSSKTASAFATQDVVLPTSMTGDEIFENSTINSLYSKIFDSKNTPLNTTEGEILLKVGDTQVKVEIPENATLSQIAEKLNQTRLVSASIESVEPNGYRLVINSDKPISLIDGTYTSNLASLLNLKTEVASSQTFSKRQLELPLKYVFTTIQNGQIMVNNKIISYTRDTTLKDLLNKLSEEGISWKLENNRITLESTGSFTIKQLEGDLLNKIGFFSNVLKSNSFGPSLRDVKLRDLGVNGGTLSFYGINIQLTGDETLNEFINKINSSPAPVVARLEDGQLFIYQDSDKDGSPDPNGSLSLQDFAEIDSFIAQKLKIHEVYNRKLNQYDPAAPEANTALALDFDTTKLWKGKTFSDIGILPPTASASININGYNIIVDPTDNLTSLAEKINSTEGLKQKVFATVTNDGQLLLFSNEKIEVEDNPVSEALGLTSPISHISKNGMVKSDVVEDKTKNLFSIMIEIRDAVIKGDTEAISLGKIIDTPYTQQDDENNTLTTVSSEPVLRSRSLLEELDSGMSKIRNKIAQLGVWQKRLENNDEFLQNEKVSIEKTISDIEDADLSEVVSQLRLLQVALQVTLSTGAKILPLSLADFM